MFYYCNGLLSNQKEIIHDEKAEGAVTNVVCYNDLVAWSTATKIRLIHYSKKQKICLIEQPKRYGSFPDYLYTTTASKPHFSWKKEQGTGDDLFQVVWLNLVKVCRLK